MKKQIEVLDRKQLKNILGGVVDPGGTGNACADRVAGIVPGCKAEVARVVDSVPPGTDLGVTLQILYASCLADAYGRLAAEGCPEESGKPS